MSLDFDFDIPKKILDVNIEDYSELLTLSYKIFAIKNTKIKTKIT